MVKENILILKGNLTHSLPLLIRKVFGRVFAEKAPHGGLCKQRYRFMVRWPLLQVKLQAIIMFLCFPVYQEFCLLLQENDVGIYSNAVLILGPVYLR